MSPRSEALAAAGTPLAAQARRPGTDLVIQVWRDPECLRAFRPVDWDLLLRQATRADMLARLAWLVEARGLSACVPAGPAAQFEGVRRLVRVKHDEVRREVAQVRLALQPLQVPVVLLKGAAYVIAGLPASAGRLFSDVDLMVPKASLAQVEASLLLHGWFTTHQSAYDQRYYRQWMHELPPMQHLRRQTTLDVHHAIAPETARWRTDSSPLFDRALALPDVGPLRVLAPPDMVLHSMVHLLLNEELGHGLRDLTDIDLLLRHFAADANTDTAFWPLLVGRASELGLQRALHHGLRCAATVLATPVPPAVRAATAGWGPGRLVDAAMHAAYRRALRSPHPSSGDWMTAPSLLALYVRAHWLRMPPALLARHLFVKATGLNKEPKERVDPQNLPKVGGPGA